MEVPEPNPTGEVLYVVLAFRYGGNENTFPIGVFSKIEAAEEAAREHRSYRGGKYDHRVYPFVVDVKDDEADELKVT